MIYGIGALAVAIFGYFGVKYINGRREVVNNLNAWQNERRPIIIGSQHPGDRSLRERYQHAKAMLEESGNQWDVPVYIVGYRDIGTTDDIHEHWNDYLVRLGDFTRDVDNQWAKSINAIDRKSYEKNILNYN